MPRPRSANPSSTATIASWWRTATRRSRPAASSACAAWPRKRWIRSSPQHPRLPVARPALAVKAEQRGQCLVDRSRALHRCRVDAAQRRRAVVVVDDLAPARPRQRRQHPALGRQRQHRADLAQRVGRDPVVRHRPEQRRIGAKIGQQHLVPACARRVDAAPQPGDRRVRRYGVDQRVRIIALPGGDGDQAAHLAVVPHRHRQRAGQRPGPIPRREVDPVAAAQFPPPGVEPGGRLERRGARVAPPQRPMLVGRHRPRTS